MFCNLHSITTRFMTHLHHSCCFSIFRRLFLPVARKMTGVVRKRAKPSTATRTPKSTIKSKSRKVILQKQIATPDKKITDFFPVRKSNRITAKVLEVCTLAIITYLLIVCSMNE